jgi:hypothetical protein
MTARLVLLSLCALLGALTSQSSTRASTQNSRMIAAPAEGHSGNLIYLSGGGFAPHQRLSLEARCTGVRGPTYLPGPVTSGKGTFVGFRIAAPTWSGSRASRCQIYASGTPRGQKLPHEIPAKYTLIPAGQPLSRCATRMCLKVTAVLSLTQRGAQGNVVINAWPGAVASAAVVYPGGNVKYRGVRVGWQGSGDVRVRIAKRIKSALKARVYATAVLGSISGSASADFIVFPNH